MKLSIIVPVYNAEKYLKECIDSILAQTFKEFELVLVNDGSSDKSGDICNEYAKCDKRIKVMHQDNLGQVCARRTGLMACNGEYIAFVDSDDYIQIDMYEELMKKALEFDCEVVSCDAFVENGSQTTEHHQKIQSKFYDKVSLLKEVYPVVLYKKEEKSFGVSPVLWNKVYKRNVIFDDAINVDSFLKTGEDVAITVPIMLKIDSYYYLDKNLYHYRVTPDSVTKKYDSEFLSRLDTLFYLLNSKFEEINAFDMTSQMYLYESMMFTFAMRFIALNNEIPFGKKISLIKETFATNKYMDIAIKNSETAYFDNDTAVWFQMLKNNQIFKFVTLSTLNKLLKK